MSIVLAAVVTEEVQHRSPSFPAPRPKYVVTIKGTKMSYLAALDEICRQTELVWQITPKCILVTPKPAVQDVESGKGD